MKSNDYVKLGIYVPSYQRSNAIKTYNLVEGCKYVVRKSERSNYINAGIKEEDLISVEDELINSVDKVYWWIINNACEDIICICDDDIDDFQYMLDYTYCVGQDKSIITAEIERQCQLIYDLEIGFGFLQPNAIPYYYISEFCFKGVSGAVKFINKKFFKAKYDKDVWQNFDLDIILQELIHNRIVLSPRYFYDKGIMDKKAGGNANKLRQDQIDSISNMCVKWGKYFKYNFSKNKPNISVKR